MGQGFPLVDEDEGSCRHRQANRVPRRLPACGPGKSRDQRKPSGCAITRHLPSRAKLIPNAPRVTGETKRMQIGASLMI
jgi:hypothetical protein